MFINLSEFLKNKAFLKTDESGSLKESEIRVAVVSLLARAVQSNEILHQKDIDDSIHIMVCGNGLNENESCELYDASKAFIDDPERCSTLLEVLNKKLSIEQKLDVMALMWQVIRSDGIVDSSESKFAACTRASLDLTLEQAVLSQKMAIEREKLRKEKKVETIQ